MGLYIL